MKRCNINNSSLFSFVLSDKDAVKLSEPPISLNNFIRPPTNNDEDIPPEKPERPKWNWGPHHPLVLITTFTVSSFAILLAAQLIHEHKAWIPNVNTAQFYAFATSYGLVVIGLTIAVDNFVEFIKKRKSLAR